MFVGDVVPPSRKGHERFSAVLERNSSQIVGQSDAISARNKADAAKVGRVLTGAGANLKQAQAGLPEAPAEPAARKPSKGKSTTGSSARRDQAPIVLETLITEDVDLNGPVEGIVA